MARFLRNKIKVQGSAPGSLIFIGQKEVEQSRIEVWQYNVQNFIHNRYSSLQEVVLNLNEDKMNWISIYGLHDASIMAELKTKLGIPSLLLEDFMNTDERPKLVEDSSYIYMILKCLSFDIDTYRMQAEQMVIILGRNIVLTIQEFNSNYFVDVVSRLENQQGKIRMLGADYLCYTLVDTLVDNYIFNLEKLGAVIEMQTASLMEEGKKAIHNIYRYKTELSFVRKTLRPIKEVISRLSMMDSELVKESTLVYFRDVRDLMTQAVEAIEIYDTVVSNQQNMVNSNISNRQSDVMRVLTIFSTIFIPLTFLAGVFGMNFSYLPGLHNPDALIILIGIMIIIVIIMVVFLKRKKWL